MKKRLSLKNYIWIILVCIFVLIGLIFEGISQHLIDGLQDQKLVERWSAKGGWAQISAFFSSDVDVSIDTLQNMEYSILDKLSANSLDNQSENEGARTIISCYSTRGVLDISGKDTSATVEVLGVAGDFFLFHPVELISGAGFNSEEDVNDDYIILDEATAWKLFGSSNVVGQTVMVDEIPLIVAGVAPNGEGRLAKAAGLSDTLCYVSYNSLVKYAEADHIDTYEVLMPNPVEQYALAEIQTGLGLKEHQVEFVENTYRFSLLHRINVIRAFGTRSMNGKAILYPYWENIARGTEDLVAVFTLITGIFLILAFVILAVVITKWWLRNKAGIWQWIKNKMIDLPDYLRKVSKQLKSERIEIIDQDKKLFRKRKSTKVENDSKGGDVDEV